MNLKTMLIEIISADQRIRDYEKYPNQKNAERCIKAYKEVVIEFCRKYEEEAVKEAEKESKIKELLKDGDETTDRIIKSYQAIFNLRRKYTKEKY